MNPTIYNLIVYLTIVSSTNDRWQESSPSYLAEKARILSLDERDAWGFGYLDRHNMSRAIAWCRLWHLDVPEVWSQALDGQNTAAEALGL